MNTLNPEVAVQARIRKQLQVIPNVGPAAALDLYRLGIHKVSDLKEHDPKELYDQLTVLDGQAHDPCVLDVLISAVEYAVTGSNRPWWEYSAARKATLS